ncbi:hypothetical protein AG1IA_00401 [Rhizoctonia solani AG-1 IA]|uniref:Uncharacterized protein n=1 Tax=Thanatephorus cucumeris (strain AG1-IA) TaxID=983506 RepID=L8X8X1_THACA|nr:hypothetical protein AG1IA_00401 [Rhizoctonia solani AG-1 IA]
MAQSSQHGASVCSTCLSYDRVEIHSYGQSLLLDMSLGAALFCICCVHPLAKASDTKLRRARENLLVGPSIVIGYIMGGLWNRGFGRASCPRHVGHSVAETAPRVILDNTHRSVGEFATQLTGFTCTSDSQEAFVPRMAGLQHAPVSPDYVDGNLSVSVYEERYKRTVSGHLTPTVSSVLTYLCSSGSSDTRGTLSSSQVGRLYEACGHFQPMNTERFDCRNPSCVFSRSHTTPAAVSWLGLPFANDSLQVESRSFCPKALVSCDMTNLTCNACTTTKSWKYRVGQLFAPIVLYLYQFRQLESQGPIERSFSSASIGDAQSSYTT